VQADIGLVNDDGVMETGAAFGCVVVVVVVVVVVLLLFSDFWLSPEQLLVLDGFDRGDAGREMPVAPAVAVFVSDTDELVVEGTESVEVSGGLSARPKVKSAPADFGLRIVGESLLRKSR